MNDGFHRNEFISSLVGGFIRKINMKIKNKYPSLSLLEIDNDTRITIEILKQVSYKTLISSSKLRVAEYRGYDIVTTIFEALANKERKGFELLPDDYRQVYESSGSDDQKYRTICDFIAGMTERYALEFYGRLKSENPQTIFKPL